MLAVLPAGEAEACAETNGSIDVNVIALALALQPDLADFKSSPEVRGERGQEVVGRGCADGDLDDTRALAVGLDDQADGAGRLGSRLALTRDGLGG
jgi:hypothetical protein